MKRIILELEEETITRLEACNGNPGSALTNEILGMDLIEAWRNRPPEAEKNEEKACVLT